MKIFLVIEEADFYQPNFVHDLLSNTRYTWVGAALVTKVKPRNSFQNYMAAHWYYLTLPELFRMATKKIRHELIRRRILPAPHGLFDSVRQALEHHSIPFFEAHYNINQPCYLDQIRALSPDIILSSNSLIFGTELLNLPPLGCINRHSALLPAYGGVWPVFQALRCGEEYVGVTVHRMSPQVDRGEILSRITIPTAHDTVDALYQKCFSCSAQAVFTALENLQTPGFTALPPHCPPSYFSFPTRRHWQQFRRMRKRFI